MLSIKELFRIGNGPSSSHTMGPKKAAELFAATGKGHLTDRALLSVLEPIAKTHIEWLLKTYLPFHPNALKLEAYDSSDRLLETRTLYSVGGGALSDGNKIFGISEGEGGLAKGHRFLYDT